VPRSSQYTLDAQLNRLGSICLAAARRVLNKKHPSAVDAAVNAILSAGAAKPEAGAAARQQRLLPLLKSGLAGSAGALLPSSLTTMRLAVDAVSPAARIVVRCGSLPVGQLAQLAEEVPALHVIPANADTAMSPGAAGTGQGGAGGGVGTAVA
jgi:hypothetical protein